MTKLEQELKAALRDILACSTGLSNGNELARLQDCQSIAREALNKIQGRRK